MNNPFYEQKMFNHIQMPVQKFMELNVKTIQGLSYMKPADLLGLKKPEELFEKNMDIFVRNSHLALNYMHDTFHLFEDHWLNVSRGFDETAKKMVKESSSLATAVQKPVKKAVKKAVKVAAATHKSAMKKTVSNVKAAAKNSVKVSSQMSNIASGSKQSTAQGKSNSTQVKSKTASPVKQSSKVIADKSKPSMQTNQANTMSKVGAIPEKSGVKDLGLNINKGTNFPN